MSKLSTLISWVKQNAYLIVPISIFAAGYLFYIWFDTTPPHWDGGRHLSNALDYWEFSKQVLISNKENGRFDALASLVGRYYYYPPAYYYVSLPFMAVFGRTYSAILVSNLVWITLMITSIIGLGRSLKINRLGQFLGLVFVLCSPFIIGNSRENQLDIPLLAVVLFTIWRLHKWQISPSYPNLIAASFGIGLGFLTKWTFVIYLPGILLFFIPAYLWNLNRTADTVINKVKSILITAYLGLVTIVSINGVWYLGNLTRVKLDLTSNGGTQGILEGDPQGIGLESMRYYLSVIVNEHFWLPWLAIFLVLTVTLILTRPKNNLNREQLLNIGYFGIFYFGMMLIYLMQQGNKDTRYAIIFYVPYLFIAFGIGHYLGATKPFLQKLSLTLISVIGLITFLNLSLPLGVWNLTINPRSIFPIKVLGQSGYTNQRPRNQKFAIYELLETAATLKSSLNQTSCYGRDYWQNRATIGIDLEFASTFTDYGTLWGLARQYGLEIGDTTSSCFLIVNGNRTQLYQDGFKEVKRLQDPQGFELTLLQRR